jgi:phage-related protein
MQNQQWPSFIKKTQKTPEKELKLAKQRMKELKK